MTEDPTGGAAGTLDDLCRRAAELIAATGGRLKRVRVRAGDMSIEVEWPDPAAAGAGRPVPAETAATAAVPADEQTGHDEPAGHDDGSFDVEAPLVGTFYRASGPGARPFVEVGDEVEAGGQVAIVEAMKLMNAVTAERAGRVVEVLVSDAQPVEYGQPLFVLAPV
ncbi:MULTISPECIES: acetyl-CoA carboxylase biotin carboxyl carrier protein [Thermomonosporaceae]|uniref:acetyl-CoA carboxylase biotin carboxyl carrier protein n=1 Tax=Thermomonosporaceae TaxID=2012 RepID=UPI00255AD6CE|nr:MULTISPECIES: acetyl-CoA carboxylase biotin carboxyl carrier protein [Thermomonosporaceae]MDL4774141.1 acetyl-CoA carboxylase biotin carboxyl carrier protein [Actinomadura xylanilytica]